MMFVQSNWRCPYCGHTNNARWDATDFGAELRTCDANQGGCGGIAVVNVARVEVALRVRRVEGEGAAEGQPVPPVPARAESTPEDVTLSAEVDEPLPDFSPAETVAVPALIVPNQGEPFGVVFDLPVGPEPQPEPQPEPAVEPLTKGIAYKWPGYHHEIERMSRWRSFTNLPRSTREGIVRLCGQQIAAHVCMPPTMVQWDALAPLWMPSAAGVAQSYLTGGWKAAAEKWHLQAKGLVQV